MEDQFGGRTDDDLFSDDFEPVSDQAGPQNESPAEGKPAAREIQQTSAPQPTVAPAATSVSGPPVPNTLAQSRHNKSGNVSDSSPLTGQPQPITSSASESTVKPAATVQQVLLSSGSAVAPATAPSGPSSSGDNASQPQDKPDANARLQLGPGSSSSGGNAAQLLRLQSGANPRTKLTEEELAAKMEKMRILSAEKTRRFEQAQQDESDHAVAYAQGMEEARRRRALEDEKRRRGEEERRRMEEERAKNRERKLAAMGQKEGGWDEGKEAVEEANERRTFKASNGGVRGLRNATGFGGSRFAAGGEQALEKRDFGGDRANRGRGRGRGGPGRGSRGGGAGGSFYGGERNISRSDGHAQHGASRQFSSQPPPSAEDFPALPTLANKKPEAPSEIKMKTDIPAEKPTSSLSPLIGKWDEEMAALDSKTH